MHPLELNRHAYQILQIFNKTFDLFQNLANRLIYSNEFNLLGTHAGILDLLSFCSYYHLK